MITCVYAQTIFSWLDINILIYKWFEHIITMVWAYLVDQTKKNNYGLSIWSHKALKQQGHKVYMDEFARKKDTRTKTKNSRT
jgi:hypothetical protein